MQNYREQYHWRFSAIIADFFADKSEDKVYQEHRSCEQHQIGDQIERRYTSCRGTAPDGGGGSQPLHGITLLEDNARAQKADAGHYLAQHPGKVDKLSPLILQGKDNERACPHRNEHICLEARVLSLIFPFDTYEQARNYSQQYLVEKVRAEPEIGFLPDTRKHFFGRLDGTEI